MNALLVIAGLGVVSLVAEFANFKRWLMTIVLVGLTGAFGLVIMDWGTSNYYYNEMMVFDNLGLAFTALLVTISIFWFLIFSRYFDTEAHQTDRTSLVIFVIAGGVIMSAFNNMAMLFLGIEILSLSLYVLAGSKKDSISSTEAAFKYFLMGSFATGFLLFGITLVYGATGSFHLHTISAYLSAHSNDLPAFFYLGVLLMLVGLAFKISAVPFHFWAPDVYEGSPLAITAFMSTVVKIAAIAAFYRMFSICFVSVQSNWVVVVQVMMILTLIIPNITAVYQNNVKRVLAYSSVGHVGYILLALITGNSQSSGVIFYYLAAYAVASLAAFFVLSFIEHASGNTHITSFNGFFKRNPLIASTMAIALMSLAGIPPLAGFFGKYMVFALAIQEGYVGLVVLAVTTSLIGVYYYFRVIVAMFFESPAGEEIQVGAGGKALLILLILMVFGLGIFPDFFLL